MMPWILQVTDSNVCPCCAVEILQVVSINLAFFTWFSLVWYILKSASCTLQSFKPRRFVWIYFRLGMETFHPQALGRMLLPFPWLLMG